MGGLQVYFLNMTNPKREFLKGLVMLIIGIIVFSFARDIYNDVDNPKKENLPAYRIESTFHTTLRIRTERMLNKQEVISIASYLRDDYPEDEARTFEFKLEYDTFLQTVYYPSSPSTKAMCKDKDEKGRELEFRDDWDKF